MPCRGQVVCRRSWCFNDYRTGVFAQFFIPHDHSTRRNPGSKIGRTSRKRTLQKTLSAELAAAFALGTSSFTTINMTRVLSIQSHVVHGCKRCFRCMVPFDFASTYPSLIVNPLLLQMLAIRRPSFHFSCLVLMSILSTRSTSQTTLGTRMASRVTS